MAKANDGWVSTAKKDTVQDFWTSNVLKRRVTQTKVQSLPPLNLRYETIDFTADKKWTDQALISTRSVDNFLAESDAFQRASFANIIEKWKEYEKSKNDRLLSSFDAHYNMKLRFRQDEKLNRSSEMKYAAMAKYYRFIGNETNPKNTKPCLRHKRLTREYEERHVRELLDLQTTPKSRSRPYFFRKDNELAPIDIVAQSSAEIRPSISVAEQSHHSFV
ncbi:unnamed protein product [Rotaria magnacalcarata]|uniref:Uncharacterized protein n=2 Tax=Rotaria magnacalcarata TaxID=392030 RepID=A0A816R050_9BILA|nr:unnamed protein product [Rotaria magnacalcarata]CAF2067808.1 unnamed protein product [Rotaria magnacalcarata]CAF3878891.1 unnamed protein product [Rotaria magnacalcarata]CAF4003043.1 unnamed protein product [Rotaria magnacalcarata]